MMDDYISNTISAADAEGKFLDKADFEGIKGCIETEILRIEVAQKITEKLPLIVKETVAKSLVSSDVTQPDGGMYTTRHYAACVRDLQLYLRYAIYAMMAGDYSVLDERLLNGLRETYNSLDIPIGVTVRAIQAMKEVIASLVGSDASKEIGVYLDHIASGLAESDFQYSNQDSSTKFLMQDTEQCKRNDNALSASREIWQRGDRAIATSAGAAFLGGLLGQLPGAIAGAILGAVFGLFVRPTKATST